MEFIKAFKIERDSKAIESLSEFEELADFKATFGKIALDSLQILAESKGNEAYSGLLESHKYFYVAFQILDDISDFEEDFINSQFNISRHYLLQLNPKSSQESLVKQKKMIYVEGITDQLYTKCLDYLKKAFDAVDKYELPLWKYEIQSLYNTVISHRLNVQGYIYYTDVLNNRATTFLKADHIKKSVQSAENYVISKMDSEGYWYEFLNDSGLSDVWSTAFIWTFIYDYKGVHDKKIKDFLLSKRYFQKYLWSYNGSWIPDADSTSFVLVALFKMGFNFEEADLQYWYQYQNHDGGFSTYNNTDQLTAALNIKESIDVTGWTSSHFCVSAFAYYAMCLFGIKNNSYKKLRIYITKRLLNDSFQTYWWTKEYYSLSYLIEAFCLENDAIFLDICKSKLKNMIDNDDSFFENEFYMGLCLNSIGNNGLFPEFKEIRDKIVLGLKEKQLIDGSWKSNRAMRIPAPFVKKPSSDKILWQVNTKGTNIVLEDFNRLFTTSVCRLALKKHEGRG